MKFFDWVIGIATLFTLCLIVYCCVLENDKAVNTYSQSIKGNSSIIVGK